VWRRVALCGVVRRCAALRSVLHFAAVVRRCAMYNALNCIDIP
jgi:hypothetical protein